MLFNFQGAGSFKGDWYFNPGTSLKGTSLDNLLNEWVILSTEFDMSDNSITLFLNGESYQSGTSECIGNIGPGGTIQINKHINVGDSDWGEAIFTEDLSTANTQKIEGYLAHKWGLASDLPNSHPHKDSAP